MNKVWKIDVNGRYSALVKLVHGSIGIWVYLPDTLILDMKIMQMYAQKIFP